MVFFWGGYGIYVDLYGIIWIHDVSVGFILGREPLISSSSSIGVVPLAGLFGLKVDRFETFMLSPHHPQANKSAYGCVGRCFGKLEATLKTQNLIVTLISLGCIFKGL